MTTTMRNLTRRLWGKSGSESATRERRFRPAVERLEGREVPAAVTASLVYGSLNIVGTDDADIIVVRQVNGWLRVDGTALGWVPSSWVNSIFVDAKGGADMVLLNSEAAAGQQPLGVPAVVDGGAGGDVIAGGAGGSILRGGSGNDWIVGGAGYNWIDGGADNDQLFGGRGNNVIGGGGGDDVLYGADKQDILVGGAGNDAIYGRGGDDLIDGSAGDDRIWGEGGGDFIFGGEGNDQLSAGTENDFVVGGAGEDVLWGDAGNDVMDGGADKDWLFGHDGNDQLIDDPTGNSRDGGTGQNRLTDGHLSDQLVQSLVLLRLGGYQASGVPGISVPAAEVQSAVSLVGSYQGGTSPYDGLGDLALGVYMQGQFTNWVGQVASGVGMQPILNLGTAQNPFLNGSLINQPLSSQQIAELSAGLLPQSVLALAGTGAFSLLV